MNGKPIFEIKPGRYYTAVWFCGNEEGDWLCAVYRDGDGPFEITYRFRYSKSTDPFDKNDIKNVYHATAVAGKTEEDLIENVRLIAKMCEIRYSSPYSEIELRTDNVNEILSKWIATPWTHIETTGKVGLA